MPILRGFSVANNSLTKPQIFGDSSAIDSRIREVEELMQRKLDQKLLANEVARTVALSASRLRHLFKNQIGASPHHYLKALRMRRGRELLETSRLSIKEIAACLGYSDPSRFVEDFRKIHGLPPKRYRVWFWQSHGSSIERGRSILHTNSHIGT
jgi:transcriptional regulator GlxA family with amidase domain